MRLGIEQKPDPKWAATITGPVASPLRKLARVPTLFLRQCNCNRRHIFGDCNDQPGRIRAHKL